MKLLVTGAAGFLGSHVADALTAAGHDVILFDVVASPYASGNQQVMVGSILDPIAIDAALEGVDAIYHFAAIADIEEAMSDPVKTLEVNVMGTARLLDAARQKNIKRFVFASSIYVYSNQGAFYRTSKQASENLIEDYYRRFGVPYTVLRFGSLYGPRAGSTNAVHRMVTQALSTKRIQYAGTGREVREYIHVFDGAAAAVDVLASEYENQIIHLTGQERMTTKDMMEMIQEIVGGGIDLELNVGDLPGHYFQTPYSYTPKLGRKLLRSTYIDIGLGLLNLIEHEHQNADEAGK